MSGERAICGARTRSGGECQRPAGWGTGSKFGRCSWHGGATESGRIHAAKLEAQAEAARLGEEAPVTAEEALEWSIRIIGGEVRFLQEKVNELQDGLADGRDLHPLARALGGAAERLARVAKLGVDADLDAKRLALDSLVVDRLGTAVSAAIADARLSSEDRLRLDAALRQRLSELTDEDLRPNPRRLTA